MKNRFAPTALLCGTALSTMAAMTVDVGPAEAQTSQATVAQPASNTPDTPVGGTVPRGAAEANSEAITVTGTAAHKIADGVTGLQPGGGL